MEKIKPQDLPFFMDLQIKLISAHGFDYPLPVKNNKKSIINKLKDKNAVIITFLGGENLNNVMPAHCHELGLKLRNLLILQKI